MQALRDAPLPVCPYLMAAPIEGGEAWEGGKV